MFTSKLSLEEIVRIGKERLALGSHCFDFLIGQPDHKPSKVLVEKMHEALDIDFNSYTDQQGLLEARRTISRILRQESISCTADNILLSSGSKPIAYQYLKGHKNHNRNVAMYAPFYPSYFNQVRLNGSFPFLVTSEEESLDILRGGKADTLIIVNPNNPDGKMWTSKTMTELLDLSRNHGINLIIDETYKDFVYSGKFNSPLEGIDIEDYENVIVIRSFSKSLGICGWRLGYSISSSKTVKTLKNVQATILNHPNSLAQYAVAESFESIHSNYYEQNRIRYEQRMKTLVDGLNEGGLDAVMPNGGFYLFLDLSAMSKINI